MQNKKKNPQKNTSPFQKSLASGNLFGKPKLANPMNQLSSIVLFTEYASYGTTQDWNA